MGGKTFIYLQRIGDSITIHTYSPGVNLPSVKTARDSSSPRPNLTTFPTCISSHVNTLKTGTF